MTPPEPSPSEVLLAVVVGAGFSGIAAARALRLAGHGEPVVLEQADALGGTWRENTYPGCACDVPSHLYSFSFAPRPGWTRAFAGQAEILSYLNEVVDREGLRPRIRFGVRLEGADWDATTCTWTVHTSSGPLRTRVLVLGLGPLNRPQLPDLPGVEAFQGRCVHTARWPDGLDLAGQRVAVVGTGASALQVVPAITPHVAHLTLLQRTPAWVLPRRDRPWPAWRQQLYARVPWLQKLHRAALYAAYEVRGLEMLGNQLARRLGTRWALRHLARQIADPHLRARLTPTYALGCKRVILSDDFYPALTQPHVEVVSEPLVQVEPEGLRTGDGRLHRVDTIVWATGFRIPRGAELPIRGQGGTLLDSAWAPVPSAYLGCSTPGFPNLFVLLGPNTGLGHNSIVFMAEAQVEHMVRALGPVRDEPGTAVDVRPEVLAEYQRGLEARLPQTVWATGCRSWYLDEHGRNSTLWPDFSFRFRAAARRPTANAYRIVTPQEGP